MLSSTLKGVLDHLRQLTDPARGRDLSDAELLERFRTGREEAAFALLVQRHGPAVLGVCRRLLGGEHDAEDAFQATFLVLIRNAAAIRKQASLAAFLHGVATRIARKARTQSTWRRRRDREIFSAARSDDDPHDTASIRELRTVLDEEIARLPDKYRMPIVLCYLAEKTHEQAARELGWPKSSVTARLNRARELLRQRLIRRGFTVPAGLLAVVLTEQAATAALPAGLTLTTVRLAVQSLRGETMAAAAAVGLADGFVKGAAAVKLTAAAALLAALGLVAASLGALTQPRSPAHGALTQPRSPAQAQPRSPQKPRLDAFGDPLPDGAIARMGSKRLRHTNGCFRLSFAPDGRSIASAGRNDLRLWDVATGKLQRHFPGRADGKYRFTTLDFSFSTDGLRLAHGAYDTGPVTVELFDPRSGKRRRRTELKDGLNSPSLRFSPDGKRVAYFTQRNNSVIVYDAADGSAIVRFPAKTGFAREFAFVTGGKSLAYCDHTDTIHIHDISTGKRLRELRHAGDTIVHLDASPDGRFLASVPFDGKTDRGEFSIWDVAAGKERYRMRAPTQYVYRAAFSPDNRFVASGCNNQALVLWDMATGNEVRRFRAAGHLASIAFSPDGKILAAASGEGVIRLWETATGRVLPGSADPSINIIHELRFSRDNRQVIGLGSTYIAWDAATGREIHRFPQTASYPWPIALSADETLLADTDRDGTIHLRAAATGKELHALKGHENTIGYMLFTADGRRLISAGSDKTIRFWDTTSGRELHKLIVDDDGVIRLAVSADGRWLASASFKHRLGGPYEVILWDLTAGREKARFRLTQDASAQAIALSPDGRFLAAGGGGRRTGDPGEVKIWDTTTGKEGHSLDGHDARIGDMAFSPDGRSLAIGDMNGTLYLWETASGRRRHPFVGHESWVYSLAFSHDGRMLASSSIDAPAFTWDVTGALEQPRKALSDEELRRCWDDLAGTDAAAAFHALRRLAAAPGQTLPFLRRHLKPVPKADVERVRQLVKALDSDEFQERQKAVKELEKVADASASMLRQMAKQPASLYVRRTLRQLLDALPRMPESLRAVRAVEALEWIATPDAAQLLDDLAKGAPDARLSREAAEARQRINPSLKRKRREQLR